MKLTELLGGVVDVRIDLEIKGVTVDSRKVRPEFVFVAYKGVETDGHKYIKQAIDKGAVAVVGEVDMDLSVPYFRVKNGRKAWARMEARIRGNPEKDLRFIGITGTDGKTTTVNLIYKILENAGKRVGMISTIKAKIGDKELDTGLHTSSPSPDMLFEILARMRDAGVEYVVLEATSHGLAQDRLEGIEFDVAVLTNLASDHMEFHKTFGHYREAKGRLFEKSRVSVLNKACKDVSYFDNKSSGEVVYYDVSEMVRKIRYKEERGCLWQEFELRFANKWWGMKSWLLGRYNLENILASSKVAEVLGIGVEAVRGGVVGLRRLEGRLEFVPNELGLNVVVDFAHTEQGVEAVLGMVRNDLMKEGERLIVMFGCNGERDRTKRAPMGKVIVRLADLVIVTMEDPRNEDLDQVFADIEIGCKDAEGELSKNYFREDDRYKAIKMALNDFAKRGDWVLLLGKGHEKSMNILGVEYEWDDVAVVKYLLNNE